MALIQFYTLSVWYTVSFSTVPHPFHRLATHSFYSASRFGVLLRFHQQPHRLNIVILVVGRIFAYLRNKKGKTVFLFVVCARTPRTLLTLSSHCFRACFSDRRLWGTKPFRPSRTRAAMWWRPPWRACGPTPATFSPGCARWTRLLGEPACGRGACLASGGGLVSILSPYRTPGSDYIGPQGDAWISWKMISDIQRWNPKTRLCVCVTLDCTYGCWWIWSSFS